MYNLIKTYSLNYKLKSTKTFYLIHLTILLFRLKFQEEEHQRVAGLDTATTTVYVVTFAVALLIYFVYAHQLKDRRAHHQVKVSILKQVFVSIITTIPVFNYSLFYFILRWTAMRED